MEMHYQSRTPKLIRKEDLPLQQKTVIAVGNFDGVHLGHQAILKALVEEAKKRDAVPTVFTFTENPKVMFFGAKYVCGTEQKLELFAELGVEAVYFAEYGDLHDYSCASFVKEELIDRFHCEAVVVGNDFRFGKGRSGDCRTMKELVEKNGKVGIVLPPVCVDGIEVSSTYIRRCLGEGALSEVEQQLGRPYSVILPVREGRRMGRQMGFPTINQFPDADRQLPRYGVYESIAQFGGKTYRGITNIGVKPTVSSESRPVFETHLMDFSCDGELYGTVVKLTLVRFLRKERCFATVDALKAQIEKDVQALEQTSFK